MPVINGIEYIPKNINEIPYEIINFGNQISHNKSMSKIDFKLSNLSNSTLNLHKEQAGNKCNLTLKIAK